MSANYNAILVVSNPSEQPVIREMLAQAGFDEIHVGDGGDSTFSDFEQLGPAVVVLCADLDAGDARSLAAAMRAARADELSSLILIGQSDGPIRNALDAADFAVDRFLSRPLSAKALSFCVRTGIDAVRPQAPESPLEDHVAAALDEAIGAFVSDAMAALALNSPDNEDASGSAGDTPAAVQDEIDDPGEAVHIEIGATKGVVQDDIDAGWSEPGPLPPREPTLIITGGFGGDQSGASSEKAPPPSSLTREPTQVLVDADAVPAVFDLADSSAGHAPVDLAERQDGESWEAASSVLVDPLADEPSDGALVLPDEREDGPGVEAISAEDELDQLDDLDQLDEFDHLDSLDSLDSPSSLDSFDSLSADEDRIAALGDGVHAQSPPVVGGEPVPVGGEFARELRRKMSAMAERLFPGGAGSDSAPASLGAAHGHATEIDLSTLGTEDPARFEPEPAPYADPGRTEIFSEGGVSPAAAADGDVAADVGTDTADDQSTDQATTARRRIEGLHERGTLGPRGFDVATVFARLFVAEFSGHVSFRAPPVESVVHFERGRPVFASSDQPHDRMGDLLYREGKITREQLEECRVLVGESGRRMGAILVDRGCIKRRELLPAVRRHLEDIIYGLFGLNDGEYEVYSGETASGESIRLSKHPAALILEGMRRRCSLRHLEQQLGSETAVVAAGPSERLGPVLSVADLSRSERAAIGLFDGKRSLIDVRDGARISLLNVYQLACGLVTLGAADIIYRGADLEDEPEPTRPPTLVGETDLAIDRKRVLAKYALVDEADYFTLLGVRRDASSFEIKRAYESARRDYAHDSFPRAVREQLDEQLEEIGELLDEAFRVLQDESLRLAYVSNLRD